MKTWKRAAGMALSLVLGLCALPAEARAAQSQGASTLAESIVIDGQFNDWDGVAKTDVSARYAPQLNETALVWDGDRVYLYFMLEDSDYTALARSGPNQNGKFRITTDLDYVLTLQVMSDGSVAGIDALEWAADTAAQGSGPHMWEISFPSEALPPYLQTITLGYPDAPMVENVADLRGAADGPRESIVYDGLYGDWSYYPHSAVDQPGAEMALFLDGTTLYGHVSTTLPGHLEQHGAEMELTYVRVNDDESKQVPLRPIAVDAQGNIDWTPQLDQSDSTHEYLMVRRDRGGSAPTLAGLEASGENMVVGRAYVTAGAGQDDMEFQLDMDAVAKCLGMDPAEVDRLSVHSALLGGADAPVLGGVSTGPWLGTLVCLGTAGAVELRQKRRRRREEERA